MNNKIYGLLGMAKKAGKTAIGDTAIEMIRSQDAKLVILSKDCSERTKKQVNDKCNTYHIEILEIEQSEVLSSAIGRSSVAFVAICDSGFAEAIKKNK
ncbi:MAG: L7Ae/L30e/S12e/Gadd45 family ribosomal protein [Anaerorhabdus sp.]